MKTGSDNANLKAIIFNYKVFAPSLITEETILNTNCKYYQKVGKWRVLSLSLSLSLYIYIYISLGFSVCSIMSSANTESFTYFPVWILSVSFSSPLPRLGLPTLLNQSGESGHCLSCSWYQRKCFQLFTTEHNVTYRLIIYGPFYLEVGFLYAHLLESFVIDEC